MIARVAPLDVPVLLYGETGTGKGLVARELHARSPRAEGPFVHLDLASLAPGLLESELFGHERGAFTGAAHGRRGRFEVAAGGTILLDEIGELPASGQLRLLRVLQEGCFERVGGTHTVPLEARVVAATNLELGEAVRDGRFRRDLYYRLDVIALRLPPLRERPEDLPELVRDAVARIAARLGRPAPPVRGELLAELRRRSWPGNVRELHHLLERALVWSEPGEPLGRAVLERAERGRRGPAPAGESAPSRSDEVGPLETALRETGGNVARAARRLGMARTTLRRRIHAAGLQRLLPRD